jgi:hypothetical protein
MKALGGLLLHIPQIFSFHWYAKGSLSPGMILPHVERRVLKESSPDLWLLMDVNVLVFVIPKALEERDTLG